MAKKNKMTSNLSKITYLLFNKQLYVPISFKFNLILNQKKTNFVKYLGMWINDRLNWSAHIHPLSLQLAKYCRVLLHMSDFVLD